MPSIQYLTMIFDDENKAFAEGDTLTGKVTLALLKETAVESLFVKAKGDASVHWTKKVGDKNHTYSAHRRLFKLKQFLIPADSRDNVVPKGVHVYKFNLKIPHGSLPSSFKGAHGKIVYRLEVKLSRSWRIDRTLEKKIHFVSKCFPNLQSLIESRQVGSTNKEVGVFSKGSVRMDAFVDRKAYAPGETIAIVAKINNSSSSEMTPKFSFFQDVVYRAQGSVKSERNVINKVVDHCIKPKTEKTVKCAFRIAPQQTGSIQNCEILSVEYFVKVYLDISFAFDPEIVFPVVVFSSDLAHGPNVAGATRGPSNSDFPHPAVPTAPYPAGAVGGPSNSNFPPPAASMHPYPVSPHSGRYGNPRAQTYSDPPPMYPAQPVNGGFNNPTPQLASPYGSPFSSPSSVLHPPPFAPTFSPTPSAPEIQPPPFSLASNISPSAPTYNLLPSAPDLNTDFLSQSDEAPPSYSILFPTPASENSDSEQ